jgi:hypothetical protein
MISEDAYGLAVRPDRRGRQPEEAFVEAEVPPGCLVVQTGPWPPQPFGDPIGVEVVIRTPGKRYVSYPDDVLLDEGQCLEVPVRRRHVPSYHEGYGTITNVGGRPHLDGKRLRLRRCFRSRRA